MESKRLPLFEENKVLNTRGRGRGKGEGFGGLGANF